MYKYFLSRCNTLNVLLKSTFLLMILLSIFLPQALAAGDVLELGIKGEIGAVSMDRNLSNDFKTQLGYGIGLTLNYRFHKIMGFEIGAFISVKGADTKDLEAISISYLSTPLLLYFDPFDLGLFLSAGIQSNILMNALIEDRQANTTDISKEFNQAYLDTVFGLGYRSNQLSFEVRYEYGITDMTKDNGYFGSYTIRNQSVFFLMGVHFKL